MCFLVPLALSRPRDPAIVGSTSQLGGFMSDSPFLYGFLPVTVLFEQIVGVPSTSVL